MKKLLFVLLFFAISCKPEENTSTTPINDNFMPDAATLLKSGEFVGSGHTVSGTATLYTEAGVRTLVLDPFMTQNGPDLKVYISTDANASKYISLGDLKSIVDKQSYTIPNDADLTGFDYVLIWCEQFTVLFGSAQLN